jgi:5-methylcytosine-specific restriction endonuclease McrA
MPKRDTPYAMPQWRRIRLYVLARDKYECQIRMPGCKGRATAADHIVPWLDGGAWLAPENLRAACGSCNSARANKNRGNRKTLPPSREWI